jgi:hypothetical protein
VSDDPAAALGTRLERLIGDAQAFRSFVRRTGAPVRPNAEWEMDGARTVRRLVDSLQSIEADGLAPLARHGLKELRRLVPALIKRWKWDRVVGAEGEAVLAEQARRLAGNERRFRAACRSYIDAFSDGLVDRKPAEDYFEHATIAEAQGIQAITPALLREEDVERFRTAWIHSPYLARKFPALRPGEFQALDDAIRDLCPDRPPRPDRPRLANHAGTLPEPADTGPAGSRRGDIPGAPPMNPRDPLGEMILRLYLANSPGKKIAEKIDEDGRWGRGWTADRVDKELVRYCKRHNIERPRRKHRRNRQQ